MKIIHVITAFGIGGAEKLLLNVVNRQIKNHEVHLVYLKPIIDLLSFVDRRVQIKYIPINFSVIANLKKYYQQHRPDIIHTHLGHADFLGIYAANKVNINAKVFCTMHNIYFKKNIMDDLFFWRYKNLLNSKGKSINVISISKSVENHVLTKLKVPKSRSYLLYNAIQKREITHKKEKNINFKILFVGRLTKQKSIDTLLKAINYLKNKNVKLTIVGDGELKCYLTELAEKLIITDQVNFVGQQEDTSVFYNNADIFILPSIWEGFGIVILEAFRAKLPVIASNIEGPAELIKDNKNGLLFTPKNHIELANKIELLIKDDGLKNHLAINGYKTFNEKFEIENYVKKLNELYVCG